MAAHRNETLGDRVRAARAAKGMSQAALGAEAKMSASHVSLIETGLRSPSSHVLEALARALDTSPTFLEQGWQTVDGGVEVAVDFARLALTQGDAAGALDRLVGLDLERVSPATRARARTALAEAHELCGDLDRAIAILEEVLQDAHERDDAFDAAAAAMPLVTYSIESGDLIRAGEIGEAELARLEAAGLAGTDEHLRLGAAVLWAYTERGDLAAATNRAGRLIRQAEELGTPLGRGSVYWNAGLLAEERRDFVTARRYAERALALLGEYNSVRDLPRLRVYFAHLLLVSPVPAPADALLQLEHARPGLTAAGSPVELAVLETEQARAQLLSGDVDEARALANQAIARLGDEPRLEASEAHLVLGDVHQALGQPDQALTAYRWAAERLSTMSACRRSAGAWRKLADRYRAAGEVELALEAFARGMAEAGFPEAPPVVQRADAGVADGRVQRPRRGRAVARSRSHA
ncbi:helix-turn-helix transcriptional regulator [Cellulomonas sp. HD19AZ1]|uniref:helix-turn-helix domain-containing protein n=1 Tax=Cellulomonas sp. HD19AZ1 TaxID=2559593 RepID=UPI0010715091|nr:helix-turn-helix transcriptional regulator [Cellulomonas sp. HD19AZ1]TFH68126.1 helix-turn-helix domain-containing protein [Cellulomonas sp. HD19AZ1]